MENRREQKETIRERVPNGAECSRKVASGSKVAGAIRSLVNTRDLKLECVRVLHET